MKNTLKIFTLIAALLTMVACEKDNENPVNHERDITYTIAPAASAIDNATTTTIHLETEAEWQELLDRFCDYAEEGSEVTFYNANHKATKSATKDATTFSTSDREAMKRWMAQMEDEGKTVTVTYDSQTGTWNGTAYANAPQPPQEGDCYTGEIVFIPRDYYQDNPTYPYWGLKVSEDSIFRLARGGVYLTTDHELTIDGNVYHRGDIVTLCGTLFTYWDQYEDYFVLSLDNIGGTQGEPPLPVYRGSINGWWFMMTLDEEHHKMYCTSTFSDTQWQGRIGGGVFRYEETNETDNLGNPVIIVYDEGYNMGSRFSIERTSSTSLVLRDLTETIQTDLWIHTLGEVTMQRTYNVWETWVCDTLGFNIVMHLNTEGCVPYSVGYSSSPFYVNCTTPFEIGEFISDSGLERFYYSATGNEVFFTTEYIYNNNDNSHYLILSPTEMTSGCVGNYKFREIR